MLYVYRKHMAVGEGCRWSFLVDDWGWQQVQEDFVVVNRKREREGEGKGRTHLCCLYTSG